MQCSALSANCQFAENVRPWHGTVGANTTIPRFPAASGANHASRVYAQKAMPCYTIPRPAPNGSKHGQESKRHTPELSAELSVADLRHSG